MKGKPTIWTDEMIEKMKTEFPNRFTKDIADELNLGNRTIVRKAREMGLKKVEGFLDIKRKEIVELIQKNKGPHPHKGDSSYTIPNGEKHRFKKGHVPVPCDYKKATERRNEIIRQEKMRIKYGLPQKTKLKLVNVY